MTSRPIISHTSALVQTVGQVLRALALAIAFLGFITASSAEEPSVGASPSVFVLVVEQPGCPFCAAFEKEIAPGYDKTPEGQYAPLKRVGREAAELKDLKPVVYTPTFIVMRGGAEVGRQSGYPGADYFWEELRPILVQAGFNATAGSE